MGVSGHYKKRYSYSDGKKFYIKLFLFIVFFIGVGYASISTKLTINGTTVVTKNTWDVHFETLVKDMNSTDLTSTEEITDDTTVDFNVVLSTPGDFYSFTVDVVNNGTIDAMLGDLLATGLSVEQEKIVDYTVTYADGEEVLEKDALPAGGKETLLVTLKYSDDITAEDLLEEDEDVSLTLDATYVQDDGTSTDRRPPKRYLYNEIVTQNQENGLRVLDNQASTYVTATTGIDLNVKPSDTNGKGVYIRSGTESDTNPVYYYRGAVTNNNVIFGGYCWKMVRTTETGGIKLIYNGTPTDGSCNNTGKDSQIGESRFNVDINSSYKYNAYVGYMYGTPNSSTYEAEHLSTKTSTSSTIKTYIDTWYSQKMTSYTSYLEDTIWCNDRSVITAYGVTGTGAGSSETYYGAYERRTSTPSLECINQNDRFTVEETVEGRVAGNGALTYPVALLTADEATLGGGSTSYLNSGRDWWSLSPAGFDSDNAFGFFVNSVDSDGLYGQTADCMSGVRPSVSLRPGTQITEDGDGSVNSPFVVK